MPNPFLRAVFEIKPGKLASYTWRMKLDFKVCSGLTQNGFKISRSEVNYKGDVRLQRWDLYKELGLDGYAFGKGNQNDPIDLLYTFHNGDTV